MFGQILRGSGTGRRGGSGAATGGEGIRGAGEPQGMAGWLDGWDSGWVYGCTGAENGWKWLELTGTGWTILNLLAGLLVWVWVWVWVWCWDQ